MKKREGNGMSELLFKSYEVARGQFVKNVDALEESILDIQPEALTTPYTGILVMY